MVITEDVFLGHLRTKMAGLGMPLPEDLRGKLPRHDLHRWSEREVTRLLGLVVHQELGWNSIEDVNKYHIGPSCHLNPGGVESFAYTWGIRRNGQIVLCNDFNKKTWSQGDRDRFGDENAQFMSTMLEGYFNYPACLADNAGEPTSEQIIATLILWKTCQTFWNWSNGALYGHYHFGKDACPGTTMKTIIKAIRS